MNRPLTVILLSTVLLSSCAYLSENNNRTPVCKELNSQIVFNGATSNSREAEIQNAQENQLVKSYDKECEQ